MREGARKGGRIGQVGAGLQCSCILNFGQPLESSGAGKPFERCPKLGEEEGLGSPPPASRWMWDGKVDLSTCFAIWQVLSCSHPHVDSKLLFPWL